MAAKVKWDRGAWWVVTHYQRTRQKNRVGPTKAHRREAEQIAKKVNAALALGTFKPHGETIERTITLAAVARRWLRTEIELPLERGLDGAVAPKTAQLHRVHLEKRILPGHSPSRAPVSARNRMKA